jgi:hypothetical protein
MNPRILRLRAVGLSPTELMSLRHVCRLSEHVARATWYELAHAGAPADLLVVAIDGTGAMRAWNDADPSGRTPFVALGALPADTPGKARGVALPGPILGARLLAALDSCAALAGPAPSY